MNTVPDDWRSSHRLLVGAFDVVQEGIALFDAEDRYVIWNQRYAEIYEEIVETIAVGARFEEVLRAALKKGLILDAVGREEEWLANRLAAFRRASHSYEQHMRDDMWVRVQERRMADGGTVSVRTDITELKRVETGLGAATQAAKDREVQISAIVDNVADGIVTIDAVGTIKTLNPAAARMFGYSTEEAIGQNVRLLMTEPYHGEHDGYLKKYRDTGDARIIDIGREVVGRRKDGSTFPIALTVSEIHVDGQAMFTSIVRDITERRQNEVDRRRIKAKIGEQKQQLDAAVDNMVQGLVMFDADARLVLWNQRYIDMYGLSPDIVKVGCSNLDLLKHRQEMGAFLHDPETLCRDHRARNAEGQPWSYISDLSDGRIIHVSHRPLANGCRVSTHEGHHRAASGA